MVQNRMMAADLSEAHWLVFPKREINPIDTERPFFFLPFLPVVISACHINLQEVSGGLTLPPKQQLDWICVPGLRTKRNKPVICFALTLSMRLRV